MWGVLSYGLGTLLGFAGLILIVAVFVRDLTQHEHTVLRNYPVIGHLRFLFERYGQTLRQYFIVGEREDRPFDRATRSWIYRAAKNEPDIVGFGSTYPVTDRDALAFVPCAFPIEPARCVGAPPLWVGGDSCAQPFLARAVVNISGMSYGALSEPAVRALSRGAQGAGCWLNTGEGGLAPAHREGHCDLIMQVGTAKFGIRDPLGGLSEERARALGLVVKAFEIKLSQGAKPGKGGVLPARKVTLDVARIRGIEAYRDAMSPPGHADMKDMGSLLDGVARLRDLTGRPVGVKTALGDDRFLTDLCDAVHRRGLLWAPDFLTIDGSEGGSGAVPQMLADHMGLPLGEALPLAVDILLQAGLKERIRVVASGKLVTPAKAAWALCMGADFVATGRGFLFALGCIQALR
ncbi:MAG: glutamate synthase-related protein, partial [Acidiferrobacter sp.]